MSLTLRQIAVGVAYATWEIVGGIGVLLVSFVFFEPQLSTAQYFGIALGFGGIVCIILGEEHGDLGESSGESSESNIKSSADSGKSNSARHCKAREQSERNEAIHNKAKA